MSSNTPTVAAAIDSRQQSINNDNNTVIDTRTLTMYIDRDII